MDIDRRRSRERRRFAKWLIERYEREQRIYTGPYLSRACALFLFGNLNVSRFFLAAVSAFWAVGLLVPGDTFSRPVYAYMQIAGNEHAWAALFAIHAVGAAWRTWDRVPRLKWAMAINLLGVTLFWSAALSILFTLTFPFPAAVAPDFGSALLALWILIRTGVYGDKEAPPHWTLNA